MKHLSLLGSSKLPEIYQSRPHCPLKSRSKVPWGSAFGPTGPGTRRYIDRQTEKYTYHRAQQKLPAGWDTEFWPREKLCAGQKALGHLERDTVKGTHSVRGEWGWLRQAADGSGRVSSWGPGSGLRWPRCSPVWWLRWVPHSQEGKVMWPVLHKGGNG